MTTKAKELQHDPRKARPAPRVREGRVRYSDVYHAAVRAWRPGLRITMTLED